MTKFITYFFSIAFLLGLNMTLPQIYNAAPNLLFLFVVFYAFKNDRPEFLWLAFFSGLLIDVFSGNFFGSFAISFLAVALLVNYATRTYFTSDPSIEFMSIAVAGSYLIFIGLFYAVNALAFRLHLSPNTVSGEYLKYQVWVGLFLNLIFAAPVYYFTLLDDKIIAKAESRRLNF